MNNSSPETGRALRSSIGVKLASVFLILALVPMAGTAYYNLTQSQGTVAAIAKENLLVLSRSVSSEINQLLV